ncbi:hypothetical protein RJ55_07300 [Drechmeria coniospora]|nr:hypothetical protein RJ55_07300 [Drechmeria coniospora]
MSPFGASLREYRYAPLDAETRVFRLVKLLPPRPSLIPATWGTVRVELIEHHADSRVPYDALSYAWNVPPRLREPNRRIIVETEDGSWTLRIYRPLELALLHLGANDTTSRPIFIDQICIDQNNGPEKSHQVRCMRDIYSNCVRTVVWLGPSTTNSAEYFSYVQEITAEGVLSRVMNPNVAQFMHVFDAVMDSSLDINDAEREDRDDILGMLQRFGDRFPLDGFADVLDRDWFGRLWIIQEACLAPSVVFVCGSQALCFDCFRAGALFYNLHNTKWIRQRTGATSKHELTRRNALFEKKASLGRIFQERKTIHQSGTRQELYDLVLKYSVNGDQKKIGSSLPEDRIFGLLGLAAEDDQLRRRVRVRYGEDAVQIYSEVAALLLERNVDALLYNQFPKTTPGLPSWAPDWAMNLAVPVGYSERKTPVYSAGGPSTEARIRFDEASRRLTIRACTVDEITAVGERTCRAQPDVQIMQQIDYGRASMVFDEVSDFVEEAAASDDDGGRTARTISLRLCDSGLSYRHFSDKLGASAGCERLGALHDAISLLGRRLLRSDATVAAHRITRIYRTLGITPWYWIPPPEMDTLRICAQGPISASKVAWEALEDFVEDMVGMCVASTRIAWASWYVKLRRRYGKVTLKPDHDVLARVGLDPHVAMGQDMSVFTTNLLKNAGRRLYRTRRGLLGMGPAHMRRGDLVVVFHGGTMPHVLRDVGGLWQYVGEAYCDGIMDGEAMENGIETSYTLV